MTICFLSEENVDLKGADRDLVIEILKRHPRAEAKMKYMVNVARYLY